MGRYYEIIDVSIPGIDDLLSSNPRSVRCFVLQNFYLILMDESFWFDHSLLCDCYLFTYESASYLFRYNLQLVMGLLYTKFYLDFEDNDWKQLSNDPIVFQSKKDDVVLDIEDTSHKSYKLTFKNGGKIKLFRVTGKFRLTWDDDDVIE